ncbi:DEKNAAC104952 [Brettanomyces naardenensis]|uniref:DEKNAAC104952 n=1 Tax=Brettanomyces naardenensis TaxID=13370 RepID=A0A448YSC4_BRENA|nr:DEKNAAC104952 [Brettanomyces naardenensis]
MPMFYKSGSESYFSSKPPAIPSPGKNSFLGDVFTSDAPKEEQISSGFYRQEGGEALVYVYDYDEMKINLEVHGKFTISDETGATYVITPGDTLYFKKGCTITFKVEGTKDVPESEAYALNFFCGLRPADSA